MVDALFCVSILLGGAPLAPKVKKSEKIWKIWSRYCRADKLTLNVDIELIALGAIVEIVFGIGAIFGDSVITNLTKIISQIPGENGFVGLIANLLKLAIF